jgi:transposase
MSTYTLHQFNDRYPDDEACLLELAHRRFGDDLNCLKCGRKLYRLKGFKLWTCRRGHQASPLTGTIFAKSSTSLHTWFFVMYLVTHSKTGISALEVQRIIGGSYRRSWRMLHQIRSVMDDPDPVTETVEVDETFMKAKPWRDTRISKTKRSFFASPKVIGFVERETGRAKVKVLPNLRRESIQDAFAENVTEGATVITDGSMLYKWLYPTYYHISQVHYGPTGGKSTAFGFIPHAGESTQRVENLWSNLKRAIRGTHIHVSPWWLQNYAQEVAWRYTHRKSTVPLFELLLNKTA